MRRRARRPARAGGRRRSSRCGGGEGRLVLASWTLDARGCTTARHPARALRRASLGDRPTQLHACARASSSLPTMRDRRPRADHPVLRRARVADGGRAWRRPTSTRRQFDRYRATAPHRFLIPAEATRTRLARAGADRRRTRWTQSAWLDTVPRLCARRARRRGRTSSSKLFDQGSSAAAALVDDPAGGCGERHRLPRPTDGATAYGWFVLASFSGPSTRRSPWGSRSRCSAGTTGSPWVFS